MTDQGDYNEPCCDHCGGRNGVVSVLFADGKRMLLCEDCERQLGWR